MTIMRGLAAAAAVAALVLSAAGCGGGPASSGAASGADAAALVPPDALAFVSVSTDVDSAEWRRLDELTRGLVSRDRILRVVRSALADERLDFDRDVRPALGAELNLAVLGIEDGEPEAVALVQPEDEAKLRALASRFDHDGDHYTVERVGDWSAVADSPEAFAAVRRAESGTSLSGEESFRTAQDELSGDALIRVFLARDGFEALPAKVRNLLGAAGPDWAAATAAADDDAVQISVAAQTAERVDTGLIGDVPSGASLAVAFDGSRIAAGRSPPVELAALDGPAVLYVGSGGLIPTIALEVRPSDPQAGLEALRSLADALQRRAGTAIPLVVERHGDRLFAADSVGAIRDLRGSGPKLVDDSPVRDAVDSAGGGTPFLYADFERLTPYLQAAGQLLPRPLPAELLRDLDRLGTAVGVERAEGRIHRFELRIRRR